MNLQLHITKNYNIKDYQRSAHIRIAVINKDISKEYPANFVCMLPRRLNVNLKKPCKFQQKFGDQSQKIIKKLLDQALKAEEDQEIKKELLKRLKVLNSKPKNIAVCNMCGKDFKARKYGYRLQNTCYKCLNKSRSIKN